MPPLVTAAVREWVGDFEIGKGRPYADAAVVGRYLYEPRGWVCGFVKGTRARPYPVRVVTRDGAVVEAFCGCPVGGEGRCKHVAAVLLAYVEDPDRFPAVDDMAVLESAGEAELREVAYHLLRCAPELTAQLALPMPGFVRGPVPADLFRAQAEAVIRSARQHDDRQEEEIAEALRPLAGLYDRYASRPADRGAAEALLAGVAEAIRRAGLTADRLAPVMGEDVFFRLLWEPLRERLPTALRPAEPPPF